MKPRLRLRCAADGFVLWIYFGWIGAPIPIAHAGGRDSCDALSFAVLALKLPTGAATPKLERMADSDSFVDAALGAPLWPASPKRQPGGPGRFTRRRRRCLLEESVSC